MYSCGNVQPPNLRKVKRETYIHPTIEYQATLLTAVEDKIHIHNAIDYSNERVSQRCRLAKEVAMKGIHKCVNIKKLSSTKSMELLQKT